MAKRIIYQLLPRLYGNAVGNNIKSGTISQNGCGKLSDITMSRLEELRDNLHITDIWYTGVIDHATKTHFEGFRDSAPEIVKGEAGSPYAIRNYFDVAPSLADNPCNRMEEFEALIDRTHKAGLRAIIDFVPNHVARQYHTDNHPCLGANDDTSVHWKEENDFYYYPGQKLDLPVGGSYCEYPAKATGNDCFNSSPGINDWYETIKINYCSHYNNTWETMAAAIDFWASKGVDGFRCDMVELVPPEFFTWLIRRTKEKWGNITFIAEVYKKELYAKYLKEAGFDLLYDKSGLYDRLRAILTQGASAREITWNWQELGELQGGMLNFLENHDEQRIASDYFCGCAKKAYSALAVSMLMNEAPFMIYSGQEYGERGMDNEGFSGTDGRTTIFDYWTVGTLSRAKEGTLQPEEQTIYEKYREVTGLASELHGPCYDLGYANPACRNFDPDKHFAFIRKRGEDAVLIAANFTAIPSELHINIPSEALAWLGKDAKEGICVHISVKGWDFAYQTISI